MFRRIKQTLWGALFGTLIATQALGQTATLLPNGLQQYFNAQGAPVSGGSVSYYVPGTLVPKNTWSSSVESILTQNPNPVLLNSGGYPQNGSSQPNGTFGDGSYRQIVTDQNNIVIWDAVTSSVGSSTTSGIGTTFSAGVPVGTILPWSATFLPTNYLYTAGQAVSRVTYSQLFTAITFQQSIVCQSGVATITVPTTVSDATPTGAPIEASCFAAGTTVLSKVSGTLTMTNNATATVTTSAVIFPWGNGDGSATFNVPDLRGRVAPGRDNMLSSIAGHVSQTYYGSNPDSINSIGGATGGQSLTTTNMAPYTPSGTITNGGITTTTSTSSTTGNITGSTVCGVGTGAIIGLCSSTGISISSSSSSFSSQAGSSFSGNAQGGASTPFSIVQPSITTDYIIKALPDTAAGGLTGANNGVLFNASGFPGEANVGINGQLLLGVTGSPPSMATMSRDCTITNAGVITCTATNGIAFAPSATTDTTNAANITVGALPLSNGGTGQTSAPTARSSVGLNIDAATPTADSNYTMVATDRVVYHTALTAARTDTLPLAGSVNAGQVLLITDIAGVVTGTNTITLQRAGGDTINGGTTFPALTAAYATASCVSGGSNRWTCTQITGGVGSGVTGVTIAAGAGIVVTGTCNITTTGTCTVASSSGTSATIGAATNLKVIRASATTLTVTFDEIITATSLGGSPYSESSGSHTLTISGTGANGMDTGSAPTSGFICVYSITKGDGTTFAVLGVNATTHSCPTIYPGASMPAGYIASALIGIWPTNGSAQITAGTQYGRKFYNQTPVSVFSGTGPSTLTSESISAAVPAVAKTCDILVGTQSGSSTSIGWTAAGDGSGTGMKTGIVAATAFGTTISFGPLSFTWVAPLPDIPIITSQTIFLQEVQGRAGDLAYVTAYTF